MSENIVSKGIEDARKARAPCSGSFATFTLTSAVTGTGTQIRQHISQDIATNKVKSRYLAIYCDLTKVNY